VNLFLHCLKDKNVSKKVLIIEDEKNLVKLLQVNLESRGFDVITAFDGEEGLEKAFTELSDVITLDIQLPKMDGWEVCKRIKSNPETKDMPVIFLTVIPQKEGGEKAKIAGADFYLTKPFDPSKLVDMIENIIKKKNEQKIPVQKNTLI